jgi:FkbM family methyltransferase
MNALGPYLDADTVFVDVGSNVGWYTFHMARTHKVEAFEPFLKNLQLQNTTRCLHPDLAQRIRLHPFGLSNTTKHCALFQIPTVNHGDTHTACDDSAKQAFRKNNYQKLGSSIVRRLDDVAGRRLMSARKVMKIDIEGHEYEMLLGARKFLCAPMAPVAIFMEMFQLGLKKQAAVDLLESCGYRVATANPNAPDYLFVRDHVRS